MKCFASRENQRGQTLPLWAFGTMTVLVMLAYALAYGTMVQWHIRAQNAADAAAQGLLTAQTSQWNQTIMTLHAAAIEEYRLRYIIKDLVQVMRGAGGCDNSGTASDCGVMYGQLRQAYLDSLQRYSTDITLLARINNPTFTDDESAISGALSLYQTNCGSVNGGDCAFDYTLMQPVGNRANTYLENVYADCCGFTVGGGTSSDPKQDLQPMEIEVVACAQVPWPIPSLFNFTPPTYNVVGRAAATPIMVTQEFMYVGSVVNPDSATNAVFQPSEFPETGYGSAAITASNDQNYRIDYGGNPDDVYNNGNPASSNGVAAFTYQASNMGLEVADGFWGSMAIQPFEGNISSGSFTCKS
jgi:hypothetical protein